MLISLISLFFVNNLHKKKLCIFWPWNNFVIFVIYGAQKIPPGDFPRDFSRGGIPPLICAESSIWKRRENKEQRGLEGCGVLKCEQVGSVNKLALWINWILSHFFFVCASFVHVWGLINHFVYHLCMVWGPLKSFYAILKLLKLNHKKLLEINEPYK